MIHWRRTRRISILTFRLLPSNPNFFDSLNSHSFLKFKTLISQCLLRHLYYSAPSIHQSQVNITMPLKNLFPALCASIVCLLASPSSSGKRFGVSAQNAMVTVPMRPLCFRVPGDANFGSPGGSTCS